MNAVQREYLRNTRKAVRIAQDVKWNPTAWAHQVHWAEAYWSNYLKSTGTKQFMAQMNRLKELLERRDTHAALKFIDGHAP